jgi:DNA-binding response OmpR family regulator
LFILRLQLKVLPACTPRNPKQSLGLRKGLHLEALVFGRHARLFFVTHYSQNLQSTVTSRLLRRHSRSVEPTKSAASDSIMAAMAAQTRLFLSMDRQTQVTTSLRTTPEVERHIVAAKTPKPSVIFVLEDDPDILRLIQHHLKAANFETVGCAGSSGMLEQAGRLQPSLFLLDIMLPGDSGLDVCRRIRQNHKLEMTPVVFLTAKGEESDRVAGLELGADDYIVKPFSPRELVARIRAVLRRTQRPEKPAIIRVGELEINGEAMSILVQGQLISTTPTEYRLLEYLATHAGRVFTRDQLLDAVWRDSHFVTLRSIDVFIRRLREKIEPDAEHPVYLKTVRGVGYRFDRSSET